MFFAANNNNNHRNNQQNNMGGAASTTTTSEQYEEALLLCSPNTRARAPSGSTAMTLMSDFQALSLSEETVALIPSGVRIIVPFIFLLIQ